MADGGGSTTTVMRDPPSAEQTALTQRQIQLADRQIAAIDANAPLNKALLEGASELLPLQLDLIKQTLTSINDPAQKALQDAQTKYALEQIPIQREIQQLQLDELRRGGAATPAQEALIKQGIEAARTSGNAEIDRATQLGLEQLREELAPALGMRSTDSPILDRGARLGAEAVRGKSQLATSLAGAEASAKLNFPLAASQVTSSIGLGQQGVAAAAQQFQQQLRDQALRNRLQLSSGLSDNIFGSQQAGFGLANAAGGGVQSLASAIAPLNASRGETRTTETNSGFSFGSIGPILGGVGSALSGGAALFSSRGFKDEKRRLNTEAILQAVEKLPVEAWKYKPEVVPDGRTDHVGPYAEDFKAAFGLGDGKTIPIIDALGVLFASIQALAKRDRDETDEGFGFAAAAA